MRYVHTFLAVGAAIVAGAALSAQQPAPAAAPPARPAAPAQPLPDISGIWTRVDTLGGGNYDGITALMPQAKLQPEFAARLRPQQFEGFGPVPPGFVPPAYDITNQNTGPARCAVGGGGIPPRGGVVPNSAGMSLMATRDLLVIMSDGAQGARFVYADGRPLPDPARFPGVRSIGRWENGEFIATSRGFGSGMTGFGRGWTEPSTELTETFKLLPGGKRLVITYKLQRSEGVHRTARVRRHVRDLACESVFLRELVRLEGMD